MRPTVHLAALNLFTGDIQGGLGPFLATYLSATAHWGPGRIGLVTTVTSFAALFLNAPAGAVVDRTRHPRALLAFASVAIVAGTLLVLALHSLGGVLASQALVAAGGALMLPMMTLVTLGIVGKDGFPHQQGRNQAFNHAGIVLAALSIRALSPADGTGVPFWVLASMGGVAAVLALALPRRAFNGRRAHGWAEDEPDDWNQCHPIRAVIGNKRLLLVVLALALFNLSNGSMLALLGQRLVALKEHAASWVAVFVIVAQLTMIPVALYAGSLADRKGRRRLLLAACAVTPLRAVLSALVVRPALLIPAEMLDGVASGLIGVAVPVLVADVTWGSGRTQTVLGAVNTVQGVGGALSGVFGGVLVHHFGWQGALLGLGVPALVATILALSLEETASLGRPYAAPDGAAHAPAGTG